MTNQSLSKRCSRIRKVRCRVKSPYEVLVPYLSVFFILTLVHLCNIYLRFYFGEILNVGVVIAGVDLDCGISALTEVKELKTSSYQ